MTLFGSNIGWLPPDENEKQHGRKRMCSDRGQSLLDKSAYCNQFSDANKVHEEYLCQTCVQELPDEYGETDSEEEVEEEK